MGVCVRRSLRNQRRLLTITRKINVFRFLHKSNSSAMLSAAIMAQLLHRLVVVLFSCIISSGALALTRARLARTAVSIRRQTKTGG